MRASGAVKPFPWRALERTTASEADALREVRQWATAHVDLPRVTSVLSELLGAKVQILLQRGRRLTEARGIPGGAGVVVAGADAPHFERAMLVEAELALIATAVARIASRKPARVLDVGASASPAAAGAFGALVIAALRRAHQGRAMRLLAAGPATALEADMARLGPELLAVTLTVLVENDAYEARIVVPRVATPAAPPSTWGARALTALGAVPLSIPVVAHALAATAADVASLGPGDALLLDGWRLTRSGAGAWTGRVHLAAPAGATGVRAELGDDGRLVLRGEDDLLCAASEAADGGAGEAEGEMDETVGGGGLIEAIGEVPVVVRVEVGEARMAAREWATLGPGDVVALGRRVGEAVVLRVGGVPVARGDLVDIDGEVGVRITERFADDGSKR
jgi:type III secretion system YscQ/HrcQ family protein